MELIPLFAAALVTSALFSWFNHRFIKLPTAIGVLLVALGLSLGLLALQALGGQFQESGQLRHGFVAGCRRAADRVHENGGQLDGAGLPAPRRTAGGVIWCSGHG